MSLTKEELEDASFCDREACDDYESQARRRADIVRAAMAWFWTATGSKEEKAAHTRLLHACEANSSNTRGTR